VLVGKRGTFRCDKRQEVDHGQRMFATEATQINPTFLQCDNYCLVHLIRLCLNLFVRMVFLILKDL